MTEEGNKLLITKIQEGKAIVGAERVLKELKAKRLSKVFLSCNCQQKVKDDIYYYAQLASVPVLELGQTNEELGVLCKKNFFVSVAGITV